MIILVPKHSFAKIFRGFIVFILCLSFLFIPTQKARADTIVGGPIIADTIWIMANSPYVVIANIDVWEGVTLTIQPGVTVKFDSGYSLLVNGELIAQGTEEEPIIFTSNQSNPAPDDWGNIEFSETAITTTMGVGGDYLSGSILQYSVVEYAGNNKDNAIKAHSLLIDNCRVRYNNANGIFNTGSSTSPSRITYNTVNDNSASGYGRSGGINATYSTVSNNTVRDNMTEWYGQGGGIYAENSTVINNLVKDNSANGYGGQGGGIYVANCNPVSGNIVDGNTAENSGGGIFAADSNVNSNTVTNNTTRRKDGQGGGITASNCTVSDNVIRDNLCKGSGGGIYTSNNSIVKNNIIIANSGNGGGGGINTYDSTVSSNSIIGNSANQWNGGGILASNSNVISNTVMANTITSQGNGSGISAGGSNIIGNTIVGNYISPSSPLEIKGGLAVSEYTQVHLNNLYGNEPYDVVVLSSSDISGTLNYWGTVNSADILSQVYDWYDDTSFGKLLYIPYLQEPSPDSPVPPPLHLVANYQGNTAVLSWEPLPSHTTGWGYKVYYDIDSQLPPYKGTGLNEGNSPIDVGELTSFTLTGLDNTKVYCFTVTSYDNAGRESWYSKVVCNYNHVYMPIIKK